MHRVLIDKLYNEVCSAADSIKNINNSLNNNINKDEMADNTPDSNRINLGT